MSMFALIVALSLSYCAHSVRLIRGLLALIVIMARNANYPPLPAFPRTQLEKQPLWPVLVAPVPAVVLLAVVPVASNKEADTS